jgi:hypothetical protein
MINPSTLRENNYATRSKVSSTFEQVYAITPHLFVIVRLQYLEGQHFLRKPTHGHLGVLFLQLDPNRFTP